MKNTARFTAMLFLSSLIFTSGLFAAGEQKSDSKASATDKKGVQTERMQPDKKTDKQLADTKRGSLSKNMMLVDHIVGKDVQNQRGEKVGEIEKVVIDVEKGRVGYVILTGGGILGVGEDRYIVPFNALQTSRGTDQDDKLFTLKQNKDQLMKIPDGDIETVLNQEEGRQIHQHYGVSPYWEMNDAHRMDTTIDRKENELHKDMNKDKKNY